MSSSLYLIIINFYIIFKSAPFYHGCDKRENVIRYLTASLNLPPLATAGKKCGIFITLQTDTRKFCF
jgi:hypothetical protein